MGLRARALLYRYSRTASEDRATELRCCCSSRKMGLQPVLQVTAMNLQSGLPRCRPEADTPCYGARSHRRARPRRTVLRCYAAVSPPVKWVCDPFAGDRDEPPFEVCRDGGQKQIHRATVFVVIGAHGLGGPCYGVTLLSLHP
jgi:hypothetical protein